jgi:hypothetical protein
VSKLSSSSLASASSSSSSSREPDQRSSTGSLSPAVHFQAAVLHRCTTLGTSSQRGASSCTAQAGDCECPATRFAGEIAPATASSASCRNAAFRSSCCCCAVPGRSTWACIDSRREPAGDSCSRRPALQEHRRHAHQQSVSARQGTRELQLRSLQLRFLPQHTSAPGAGLAAGLAAGAGSTAGIAASPAAARYEARTSSSHASSCGCFSRPLSTMCLRTLQGRV